MARRKRVPSSIVLNNPVKKKAKTSQLKCSTCLLYTKEFPSWRFAMMNKPDIYRFPDDPEKMQRIFNVLSSLEQQSIGELRGDSKKNRYASYSLADKNLDKNVVKYVTDYCCSNNCQLDEIHRFRIGKAERVYAIKVERCVFSLLFWDPKHKIYKGSER